MEPTLRRRMLTDTQQAINTTTGSTGIHILSVIGPRPTTIRLHHTKEQAWACRCTPDLPDARKSPECEHQSTRIRRGNWGDVEVLPSSEQGAPAFVAGTPQKIAKRRQSALVSRHAFGCTVFRQRPTRRLRFTRKASEKPGSYRDKCTSSQFRKRGKKQSVRLEEVVSCQGQRTTTTCQVVAVLRAYFVADAGSVRHVWLRLHGVVLVATLARAC